MRRHIEDKLRAEFPTTVQVFSRYRFSRVLGGLSYAGLCGLGLVVGSQDMSEQELAVAGAVPVVAVSALRIGERRRTMSAIESAVDEAIERKIAESSADVSAEGKIRSKVEDFRLTLTSDPLDSAVLRTIGGVSGFAASAGVALARETSDPAIGVISGIVGVGSLALTRYNNRCFRDDVTQSMLTALYIDSPPEIIEPPMVEGYRSVRIPSEVERATSRILAIRRGEA